MFHGMIHLFTDVPSMREIVLGVEGEISKECPKGCISLALRE